MGTSREVVFFSQNSTFQMWQSSPNVFLKTPWGLLTTNLYFLSHVFFSATHHLTKFESNVSPNLESILPIFEKTRGNITEVCFFQKNFTYQKWEGSSTVRTKLDLTKFEREFTLFQKTRSKLLTLLKTTWGQHRKYFSFREPPT